MRRFLLLLLLLPLLATGQSGPKELEWGHMVGSNADMLEVASVEFYRDEQMVNASIDGAAGYVDPQDLKTGRFEWHIGKGRSTVALPPDGVTVEWISFYDKKRYGITFHLPDNLGTLLAQRYRVKVGNQWREERRDEIGIGMAPGGYVELFLTSVYVTPDILLARGIAKEVQTRQDQENPVTKVYKVWFDDFDKEFGEAYRQYPIPIGMAWAPVMDAYRAAQPKTDTEPVK